MATDNTPSQAAQSADNHIDRRSFLGVTGASLMSLSINRNMCCAAPGEAVGAETAGRYHIPADKKLPPGWREALFARGTPEVFRGDDLDRIGMPVGGIAAGQLYLCGDGCLVDWKIFNQQYFSGYGATSYDLDRVPDRCIDQGVAIVIREGERTTARRLDRQACPGTTFRGEYPIGIIRYAEPDLPVSIVLEGFSPFVPLNAKDSALPATVLRYRITNTGDNPLSAALVGWLENAIGFHNIPKYDLDVQRRSEILRQNGRALAVHAADMPKPPAGEQRPDIVLADFEGDGYGQWKTTGEAFGDKPARGTHTDRHQQHVSGHVGEGLVNTYGGGDGPQGTLTSPPFAVTRRYLNLLVGGGHHPGETCVNLLIDGKVVRTATGDNQEKLLWHSWDLREFAGRQAVIQIVDRRSDGWGHVNVDQVTLSDQRRFGDGKPPEKFEDFGTMALATDTGGAWDDDLRKVVSGLNPLLDFDPRSTWPASTRRSLPVLTKFAEIAPGASAERTFVVTWHFPNRDNGNMYANRFDDAPQVAHHVFDNLERLTRETRLWRDTFYHDGTLPWWLLDRLHSTVSYLATGTCLWWGNGRFWAWEGVGCCHGTCTHVWNYAHAAARLFPELERSAREMQDLGAALHDNGLVGFRGERNGHYAADGQCGTVLKCFREHQVTANNEFLERNWPAIRKVLEFSITQDGNADGLIENSQHNTFDINFHGANTFVGSLYLAALRAGEEMAREMGDTAFAERVRKIFDNGSKQTLQRLWNGEYFIQQVDLAAHPKDQYGPGCLSDQVFGQGWAHQVALGRIYPIAETRQALQSIWKYNWAPDIGPHNRVHPPERVFARPGEAGLFTCTWPKSAHLDEGVRYRDEVWTGIEYQVAGHMIAEGMVEEGLSLVRAIHDRYHPAKHNPYNEVECGDHYARALASWGVYLALCGYEYHGPKGHLGFAPRVTPEDFRAAFTAAEGWGTFSQQSRSKEQIERIEIRWGELELSSLAFEIPEGASGAETTVLLESQPLPATTSSKHRRVNIALNNTITLKAGDTLTVRIRLG